MPLKLSYPQSRHPHLTGEEFSSYNLGPFHHHTPLQLIHCAVLHSFCPPNLLSECLISLPKYNFAHNEQSLRELGVHLSYTLSLPPHPLSSSHLNDLSTLPAYLHHLIWPSEPMKLILSHQTIVAICWVQVNQALVHGRFPLSSIVTVSFHFDYQSESYIYTYNLKETISKIPEKVLARQIMLTCLTHAKSLPQCWNDEQAKPIETKKTT